MISIAYWAANDLRQPLEDIIWKIPAVTLMICLRQRMHQMDENGLTLEDKEAIDAGFYDNLKQ